MLATKALRDVLGSQTNDKSVHAQALMKIIQTGETPEDRVELLSIALSERDSVSKNTKALPNKGIDQDLWDQLGKTHADMINGHLKMAFFRTQKLTDFSREVLRLIDFFTVENERIYVLATTLFSPYVPYHELPGTPVQMTESEYKHKLDSDPKRVELIDYIMALPFDERTERSSMLLQVVDDTTDKDLRVALLAHSFFRLETRIVNRVMQDIQR